MTRARGQTVIGLGLAVAIIGAWLGLHIWAIFFHRWVGADWGIAVVVIAAQSWLGAGMFIVAHDAIHGSLAPGRPRLNAAVGQVAVGLYAGFGLKKLAKGHLRHHRAPGTFADPDFHPEGSSTFAAWFYNFFTHYFGMVGAGADHRGGRALRLGPRRQPDNRGSVLGGARDLFGVAAVRLRHLSAASSGAGRVRGRQSGAGRSTIPGCCHC